MGALGKAEIMRHRITGPNGWQYPAAQQRRDPDMYQSEHNEFFAAIRAGRPINNGDYMCKSTLLAIMGRMACYTGKQVTWEQALNAREDLTPSSYAWDARIPVPEVARPGVTEIQ